MTCFCGDDAYAIRLCKRHYNMVRYYEHLPRPRLVWLWRGIPRKNTFGGTDWVRTPCVVTQTQEWLERFVERE